MPGVTWIQKAVNGFNPKENSIKLSNGDTYTYDYLVVNPGLQLRFDLVKGSKEALDDPNAPISTIYTLPGAHKFSVLRENFKGNKVLFENPPPPIKCGGAPLKITFLSEETFRKKKLDFQLNFYSAAPVLFPGCLKFSDALHPIFDGKGMKRHHGQTLQEINKDKQKAIFKNATGELTEVSFDLMHFVPRQSAPEFIRNSELAHSSGWLDVNINTL